MKNYIAFIALLAAITLQSCTRTKNKPLTSNEKLNIQQMYTSSDDPMIGRIYRVKLVEGQDTVKVLIYEGASSDCMIKY
jgi:hypothetical protein